MKTVLYFTADWCGPCKRVRPIVEEINRESQDIKFQIIDVDIETELAKQFQVASIPTFILLENGNQTDRITGAKTREELENFITYKENTQENI